VLVVLATLAAACGQGGTSDEPSPPGAGSSSGPRSAPPGSLRPWTQVHNWVYWLSGPRLDTIGSSSYELAVIDYSADGSGAREFSAQQIESTRHGGCERRVLAYLSIGEAEDYRFYWQSGWQPGNPSWIVGRNPNWRGNYRIRYWDRDWQQIVYRYLDRILAKGFDGIYLDGVDSIDEAHAAGHRQDMVRFVIDIARYARARSALGDDFAVMPQNAESLGEVGDYLGAVTGIGREEVYVSATNQATPTSDRAGVEADLDRFRSGSRGRLVLTVDYANQSDLVRLAYERSRARGYVPYVADVGLAGMRVNRGFEPKCAAFAG
jgi:cysteinyl-tRNA synthetase